MTFENIHSEKTAERVFERKDISMKDIAIIGTGVIGGLIALLLATYNLKICIWDKENDVVQGATAVNSAIVHVGLMPRRVL